MKVISNQKWKIDEEKAQQVKDWLLSNGGEEDGNLSNPHELWRARFSDATITYYKTGALYMTDSDDDSVLEAHEFINSISGSKFVPSTKKFVIGFDETGKGEVVGHTVLVGVVFPVEIASELERDIGVADTKIKHTVGYWDDIYRKVDFYRTKGLNLIIEKIPPWVGVNQRF